MAAQQWTYSGDPNTSPKDAVRFLIGDTNCKDQLLLDGEINWLLGQYNNSPVNAAIRACETIILKFSRLADETVGKVSISFSQKAKGYRDSLVTLRSRLAMEDSSFYAGGINIADKLANVMDGALVRPDFRKHMMENDQIAPWTTETEYGLFLAFDG